MSKVTDEKCFACDRQLKTPYLVITRDGQRVYVGSECYSKIKKSSRNGYQPAKGGPRLWHNLIQDGEL